MKKYLEELLTKHSKDALEEACDSIDRGFFANNSVVIFVIVLGEFHYGVLGIISEGLLEEFPNENPKYFFE